MVLQNCKIEINVGKSSKTFFFVFWELKEDGKYAIRGSNYEQLDYGERSYFWPLENRRSLSGILFLY